MYLDLFITQSTEIRHSLENSLLSLQLAQDSNTMSYLSYRKHTKHRWMTGVNAF